MGRVTLIFLACSVACSSLRSEGDPCNQNEACPWGMVCCGIEVDEDGNRSGGTCRERCGPPGECNPEDCDDDNECTEDACDESGQCMNISKSGGDCATESGARGSCLAATADSMPRCVVLLGETCAADEDCVTEHCQCVAASCPRTVCTLMSCGECQFVGPGSCMPLDLGTPRPECDRYVCGVSGCLDSCMGDDDCAGGARCEDPTCIDCTDAEGWCVMHRGLGSYEGLWAVSQNEVWAVGWYPQPPSGTERPAVFHLVDDTRTLPYVSDGVGAFVDIWVGPTAIWAVGNIDPTPAVAHWDGSTWEEESLGTSWTAHGIWSSNSHVFVVGSDGTILRRTGPNVWMDDWDPIDPPSDEVHTVWGDGDSIWAGGITSDGMASTYRRDASWHIDTLTSPATVRDIWGAAGRIWAVGGFTPVDEPFLVSRSTTGTWDEELGLPTQAIFLSVWANDADGVWVLAETPTTEFAMYRRFAANDWRSFDVPVPMVPVAISGADGVIWVAGRHGELARFRPLP